MRNRTPELYWAAAAGIRTGPNNYENHLTPETVGNKRKIQKCKTDCGIFFL